MVDEKSTNTTTQDNGEGVQQSADERIERANATAKRLEEATAKAEKIRVNEILGGRSDAGKPVEKPKALTPKEYAQQALKGIVPPKP